MKFIGQYIQQFIARFRNDVYLEDISTGTIASGGNLGLDSNNKIVKATVSGGGGVTVSDSNTDDNFPVVFHDESNNLHDDTGTFLYNPNEETLHVGTSTSAVIGTSGTLSGLGYRATDATDTSTGPIFQFIKRRDTNAGQNNDISGQIKFINKNDASTPEVITFAEILSTIANVTDGDERGKIELKVANDGTLRNGITMTGTDTAQEVDVTIANGTSSVTTVAGDLTVTSGVTLGGHTVNDIDISSEHVDSDEHLMTSAAIKNYVAANSGGSPAGSDTQVQFNNSGSFGASGELTWDGTSLTSTRLVADDTDESPTAIIQLMDGTGNGIAQLARIGSGANAHRGQLILRDSSTAKVQIKASGSSYINSINPKLGIGNSSPTAELDVTGDAVISGDLDVTGDVTISGNLKVLGDIKILPSDFIADDVGRPLMTDDSSSDRFLKSHSTAKMYASINVPVGTKATQVIIYGSGTSAVTVYEADVTSKSVTSKGTGNIGTLLNFTDITGDASNYVLIELDQTSSEEVYGGKLTIA